MNSFSGNLIAILSPIFAASLFALGGLKIILLIDLSSFIVAFLVLLLLIRIPEEIQGRVFAVRDTLQFSTIPLGILLGGFLADYVFEPFMMSENAVSSVLQILVGKGTGGGMAVMFLCTGLLGSLFSFVFTDKKKFNSSVNVCIVVCVCICKIAGRRRGSSPCINSSPQQGPGNNVDQAIYSSFEDIRYLEGP